jgi:NAD(P)H-hydrate epimerase
MKITTAAEMREIDRVTSERFGVPSLTLMENAGGAIADFILQHFEKANRIVVVCG